jgi:hypothetical protein
MMTNAVVYIAWGQSHVDEARKSLLSAREYMPNVVAYLFTDAAIKTDDDFDVIAPLNIYESRPLTKVNGLLQSADVVKEDRALYLDTDTMIVGDISSIFESLKMFDLAIAHAPYKNVPGMTDAFTAFNSGVIAFLPLSMPVINLFYRWSDLVVGQPADQYVLSRLIYEDYHDDVLVLPIEYNVRTGWPVCLQREAKILHGRYNLDAVAMTINNKSNAIRAWVPSKGMIYK